MAHPNHDQRPVVFCCVDCGREQVKREDDNSPSTNSNSIPVYSVAGIGITVAEAKMIGWLSASHGWLCPFCARDFDR